MRTAVLLILALTASSVMSNCVGPTGAFMKLLTDIPAHGLTIVAAGTAGTDITATDSPQCGEWVRTGTVSKVCADKDKIGSVIQKYLDNLEATLEGLAGTRDKYIIQQRGEVIKVLSSLRRLNEIGKGATIPAAYSDNVKLFLDFAGEIASNFTAIVANFNDYQAARETCMNALVKSQGALLCNAFVDVADGNGITRAVGTEAASFSNTVVDQLNTACFNYFTNSGKQSSIILISAYRSGLSSLVSAVEKLIDGNTSGANEDLATAWSTFKKVSFSNTLAERPSRVPTTCTSQDCRVFIDSLFSTTGVLKIHDAILGGAVPTLTFGSRVLKEEGNERRLATSGMNVDLTKYTFTTLFEKNPAKVDNTVNSKSALRNGIVACAVAALALLF